MWIFLLAMIFLYIAAGSLLTIAYYERRRAWSAIGLVVAAVLMISLAVYMGPSF